MPTEGGGLTFDGYDLIPFTHEISKGRTIGSTKTREVTGWICYAQTCDYSWEDGYDYDEVEVCRVDEGLINIITEVKVIEYRQSLGEASYFEQFDCRSCGGTGARFPLGGAGCPECNSTGYNEKAMKDLAEARDAANAAAKELGE